MRAKGAGRRALSRADKARLNAARVAARGAKVERARRLSDPPVVAARTRSFGANRRALLATQASRDYKEERGIGDRVRYIYVEKIVYVQKARLASLSLASADALAVNACDYMSTAEQDWLRDLVRTHGSSSGGTLFMRDFSTMFAHVLPRVQDVRYCPRIHSLLSVRWKR